MVKRRYLIGLFMLGLLLSACTAAVDPQDPMPDSRETLPTAMQPVEAQDPTATLAEALAPEAQSVVEQRAVPTPTETPTPDTLSAGAPEIPVACTGELTSTNQEGPYYISGSPEKTSLIEPGMPGEPILIQGYVFDQGCAPIAGAKVDFWQADADGVYDNAGYTLRGHVVTDENGFYAIESFAPGLYTGRPPHIHVKVFASDGRTLLTTQLYFPGSENSADVRNAPDLLVATQEKDAQGRQQVVFHFTVRK
jgi:protocatechuate 3,4-dioxygenase beta subunit